MKRIKSGIKGAATEDVEANLGASDLTGYITGEHLHITIGLIPSGPLSAPPIGYVDASDDDSSAVGDPPEAE